MNSILIFALLLTVLILFILKKKIQALTMNNYNAETVKEKIQAGCVLLDVRSYGEYKQHCIQGSIHIPLNEIPARIQELEQYRSREIICYCASGVRSLSAAAILKKAGFTTGNLAGGISAWNTSHD